MEDRCREWVRHPFRSGLLTLLKQRRGLGVPRSEAATTYLPVGRTDKVPLLSFLLGPSAARLRSWARLGKGTSRLTISSM